MSIELSGEPADPAAGRGPVRVLYLGGLGRSGTTIIERLLGELPGICAAGEIVHSWRRGAVEGERCGCGETFADCPFWGKVGEQAFGGWDQIDAGHVDALRHTVDRNRYLPLLAAPAARAGFRRRLDEYLGYYQRVYAAIAQVSGCRVIVDSSKHASLAFCLRHLHRRGRDVDLRVVHVVRDSRAVAHSWGKTIDRPDTAAQTRMWTYSPASAAVNWDAQNAALHLLALLRVPLLRVRYEDFTAGPAAVLRQIGSFAGVPVTGEALRYLRTGSDGTWADLAAAHTVSGNPVRFQTGRIRIRRDDRWRDVMPASRRAAVTAITFPLLAHYGYLRERV